MALERRELEPGDPLDDRRLSALLRSLPRERARAGFASRVAARLDERPRSRAGRLVTSSAAAALAVLAVAVVAVIAVIGFRSLDEQRKIAEARRALAEIRSEHRALAEEIEEIGKLPVDRDPNVLYLGGDDQTDYFVDLTRVNETKITNSVPASLRNSS